ATLLGQQAARPNDIFCRWHYRVGLCGAEPQRVGGMKSFWPVSQVSVSLRQLLIRYGSKPPKVTPWASTARLTTLITVRFRPPPQISLRIGTSLSVRGRFGEHAARRE